MFLNDISPLRAQLLGFVPCVYVVEDSEFGTEHEWEVTSFDIANVECQQKFAMEDHVPDPFVVGPATKTGDRSNRANVSKQKDKTSSASWQGFVVRWYLLGTNSFKQGLHVVVVAVNKWVGLSVVWVNISTLHLRYFVLVIAFAVFWLVLWFWT